MESTQSYKIAGHTIRIIGEELLSLPGFSCFVSKETNSNPLLTIRPETTLQDWDIPPVFASGYEETSYDLSVRDNVYFFRMKHPDGSCFLAKIHSEGGEFQAVVHQTGVFGHNSLHYAYWLLFGIAALSRQTVSIHSSAVMHQGKSVLFLGESGTGKSTHTRLWLNHLPDTELLNDDSPFIRIEANGSIEAHGSPWSGKTPCYKNKQTPVAAFVRLSQAPYNRIRRLKGVEAIGALLPSCPFAFAYDKELSESIYAILSHVLLQSPVYHLECLPDANAAQLVYSTLKQNDCLWG
ncbi:MAG: hypothetical protein FWD60_03600 [Candidatus Azobacteroides sp.]|nr:hypothetical protein [Candidatus Azobacteroides sp.]